MAHNGDNTGHEMALFALAFMLGYGLAAARMRQQARAEIERQRAAAKTARDQTLHLMRLMKVEDG